ncbi:MAG: nucleotidyltransferase family protein [Acetobacter sp.]|nr:nucleotidyltransferase family protein [Bacteroides sp.]MCM1340796.1 nucleotidyltransferase family protein [Acetobacter sp.]MCM1432647.1 nucleotidyltransferase family protein [Clostridiales bacterium]
MVRETEKKLICLLSRQHLNDNEKKQISVLLKQNILWNYIFDVTLKNKCHLLVFNNLKDFEIQSEEYLKYNKIIECMSFYNSANLKSKYEELNLFLEKLPKEVKVVPVKGAHLIKNMYNSFYIRATNDFDFLFKKKDLSIIKSTLNDLGYYQGEYDSKTDTIIPFNAKKRILYNTKMYNLLPYIKIVNNAALKTNLFDFSHSLDFDLKNNIVEEMIEAASFNDGVWELKPAHFFIHMCCHHYREGSHASWILIGKDLNIIKFCDVREYVVNCMKHDDILEAIDFAKKHNLQKAVYFTIYFVKEIYDAGFEDEILNSLDISDESFLYEYGENEYDEVKTRKKDFWTSLFDHNNKDEIQELPKYTSIL